MTPLLSDAISTALTTAVSKALSYVGAYVAGAIGIATIVFAYCKVASLLQGRTVSASVVEDSETAESFTDRDWWKDEPESPDHWYSDEQEEDEEEEEEEEFGSVGSDTSTWASDV